MKHVHAFSLILRTATIRNDANPDSKACLRFRSKLAARFLGSTQLRRYTEAISSPSDSIMYVETCCSRILSAQTNWLWLLRKCLWQIVRTQPTPTHTNTGHTCARHAPQESIRINLAGGAPVDSFDISLDAHARAVHCSRRPELTHRCASPCHMHSRHHLAEKLTSRRRRCKPVNNTVHLGRAAPNIAFKGWEDRRHMGPY